MANFKVSCLKKGVVIGRVSEALAEMYIQVDVGQEDADLEVTRGALNEVKSSLRPLKKNLRTSNEEVRLIDEGVKKMQKLLRGNPSKETMASVKTELKEMRTNFRKAVRTGFAECEATNILNYDLLGDNAWYSDTHPESLPKP